MCYLPDFLDVMCFNLYSLELISSCSVSVFAYVCLESQFLIPLSLCLTICLSVCLFCLSSDAAGLYFIKN